MALRRTRSHGGLVLCSLLLTNLFFLAVSRPPVTVLAGTENKPSTETVSVQILQRRCDPKFTVTVVDNAKRGVQFYADSFGPKLDTLLPLRPFLNR